MPDYLRVAVNLPQVSGVFDYHSPPELSGRLRPGHLVLAPFGPRQVQGVVLEQVAQPEVAETKAIALLLDEDPVLTALQLQLAQHLAESCLAPLAACIGLMLPPGLGGNPEVEFSLSEEGRQFSGSLPAGQQTLLDLLRRRGALRDGQINHALPRRNWRAAAAALAAKGLLTRRGLPPKPGIKVKTLPTAEFAAAPEDEKALGRDEATRGRRGRALAVLQSEPGPMDSEWLLAESGATAADLTYLNKRGWLRLGSRESLRDPLADAVPEAGLEPKLTPKQAAVWEAIHKAIAASASKHATPFLLYGVTGSGKTEIYLQAVSRVLAQGRSAIVLVPEISLTPQTAGRFLARFPGQVGLVHSQLSEGERYDTWRLAREGKLRVIVGARSALFAPLADIGLIVVDEEHDESYYEAGQLPHYHARQAAVAYAQLAGAVCLLGSATPDLDSYTRTQRGGWQLLELPERVRAHRGAARSPQPEEGALALPPVEIVDMRSELRGGNRSIFSRRLQAALEETLAAGQQAILFLNRRGSATYVFCRDCGYVLRCPNCDIPLTQHFESTPSKRTGEEKREALNQPSFARLICHHCNYSRQSPQACPNCASSQIRYYGTGTESVEAEVGKLLPGARVLRWDRSTAARKGAHEQILQTFSRGGADVLVGTQMLAKGLDLPRVTLVGMVLADVGLNLPDYRAAERSFQLLTQVAGRAGRSPLGGRVVLQTFQPEHYAIQAAAQHDYAAFYAQESERRRELRYPPFAQLLRLEYRHAEAQKAEDEAMALGAVIEGWLEKEQRSSTQMTGPAPCFFARRNREYRWHILLRGPDPASLLRQRLPAGWRVEVNPPNVL
ncbi:MAG: primosomal protein N' [Anaerolineales bacterium]|nr:primosomal protein N' [Anaerolineales bacterium]MCW5855621.1 primosomal protein N' [Anaerolineales bacterium]